MDELDFFTRAQSSALPALPFETEGAPVGLWGDLDNFDLNVPFETPAAPLPTVSTWECPNCHRKLGSTRGLVPCALSECPDVCHVVCLDCCRAAQTAAGTDRIQCLLCATPDNRFRPIQSMLPRDDALAASEVDAWKQQDSAGIRAQKQLIVNRLRTEIICDKRIERLRYVCSAARKCILFMTMSGQTLVPRRLVSHCIPDFDKDTVSLVSSTSTRLPCETFAQRCASLRTLAYDLASCVARELSQTGFIVVPHTNQYLTAEETDSKVNLRPGDAAVSVYMSFVVSLQVANAATNN